MINIFVIIIVIIIFVVFFLGIKSRYKNEFFLNTPKKIAFCFLCYGQPKNINIWKEFFNNNDDKYSIYLHPKYLSKVSDPFFKETIIKNRLPTEWGDVSLVEATINLFSEAYYKDSNNQKFILLSDSCLPLYNFNYIYQKLINNSNNNGNKFQTYIHQLGWDNDNMKKSRYQKLKNQQIPLKYFRKQSQWIILDRNDYKFIMEHNNIDDYRKMFAPDEHFFINMFDQYQRKYKNQVSTYVDWDNKGNSPKEFSDLDIELINKARNRGAFFIRKIKNNANINKNYLFSDIIKELTIYNYV